MGLICACIYGYLTSDRIPPHEHPHTNSLLPTHEHGGMQAEMDAIMHSLHRKTGDDFDRAFLDEMIVHHEGAVDMAEETLKNAKHVELKNLANSIIQAQTAEINMMKAWRKQWYGK